MILESEKIRLEILSETNVSPNYVHWMNDYSVTRFLESRWKAQSQESVLNFVRSMNESADNVLFGMFVKETGQHIGNIKIGSINWLHRNADIGLLIGEKESWGKGYAAEAIGLATRYAFESLNLHKLIAGIYVGNEGSYKAFLKAGWSEVGLLKQHRFYEGKYVDEYLVEIVSLART